MTTRRAWVAALAVLAVAACGKDKGGAEKGEPRAAGDGVQVAWDRASGRMTAEELEKARRDNSWQEVVQLDPVAGGGPERPNPERWEGISIQSVNGSPQHVPLYGEAEGPSVLRTQILLDRALFSPGIMDGRWGKNTAEALYWFQKSQGIPATARVDSITFERLRRAGGNPAQLVVARRLTAEDVAGPFTKIPEDIYEHAKLECSCYETLTEKLSETYHVTPELLQQLNPGVNLDRLKAGGTLHVPAVRDENAAGRGQVAKLIVSGRGTYVHAVDASGRILYHFPSTLGGKYSPSPTGDYRVRNVTPDPSWHYQPDILVGVPDDEPDAMIPKGPNVAVGVVWMALSEPHYGIHGTAEPQTIGYASSNGCVRLTNWDVKFLSRHVRPNTPVQFRDISGQKLEEDPANAESSAEKGSTASTPSRSEPAPARSANAARSSAGGSRTTTAREPANEGRGSEERARTSPATREETPKAAEETHSGHEGHQP